MFPPSPTDLLLARLEAMELLLIDAIARRFQNADQLERWSRNCANSVPPIMTDLYEQELERILARTRKHFLLLSRDPPPPAPPT